MVLLPPLRVRAESVLETRPKVAHPDEPLRAVVHRMAATGLTRFPVVSRDQGRLVGMIGLADLLKARAMNLEAEQRRERVLGARVAWPFVGNRRKTEKPPAHVGR